jgi:hypothetical protein
VANQSIRSIRIRHNHERIGPDHAAFDVQPADGAAEAARIGEVGEIDADGRIKPSALGEFSRGCARRRTWAAP